MNEKQKQVEIKKIIDVCKENSIQYDPSKLDFIEKDICKEVESNYYELIVIQKNNQLKLDDFYSVLTTIDYLEKFATSENMDYLEIEGKKIVGYIVINNTLNENRFYYFNNNYYNPMNSKKIKLDNLKTHSTTNQNLNLNDTQKSHLKYNIYYYLKDNNYLKNRIINGKLVMCLDTKNEKLENINTYINNKLKLNINKIFFSKCINMYGFQWNNEKYHMLPILVDMQTFENYYLPLISICSIEFKEFVFKLQSLQEYYLKPLTNNSKEEISLVLDLKKSMYNFYSFDEKHRTYPKYN